MPKRALILGASGRLGKAVVRLFGASMEVLAPRHEEFDLADPTACARAAERSEFDVLINCAGLTSPDGCEEAPDLARLVNAESPAALALVCARRAARMIHLSTDYVFSGDGAEPLTEDMPAAPVSVYGETKRAGEIGVLAGCPDAAVARVSWLFGPDKPAFPDAIIQSVRREGRAGAIADKWSTPTYTEDLAEWLLALSGPHREVRGILHLANSGIASWQEYGQAAVDLGFELGLLEQRVPVQPEALEGFRLFKAKRPRHTPLDCARFVAATGISPRPWRDALRAYLARLAAGLRATKGG